jgi:predicted Rdx family selenoprotein
MKEKEEKRVAQAGTGLEFSIALDTTLIWESSREQAELRKTPELSMVT